MPTSNENLLKYFKDNDIMLMDQDDDYYYGAHIHAFHHAVILYKLGYKTAANSMRLTDLRVAKIKEEIE